MRPVDRLKAVTQVSLALVHHANQYVITDGYTDRQGIGDILGLGRDSSRGFLPFLQLHLEYGVPLHLHLSGTLIEALAWHRPESFSLIKRLGDMGLLEMVGSAFSQNIMPLFSDQHNLRQLNEELWLYRHHLALDLPTVKTFWVPERVWRTEKLARLLRDKELPNGGYKYVLLDDRMVYPVGKNYSGSERERFDRESPLEPDAFLPWEIIGGQDLVMFPICKKVRYLIPPGRPESLHKLDALCRWLASSGGNQTIAVYGDDLEKTAGVGGWDSRHLAHYEKFLAWLRENEWVRPVLLHRWAEEHGAAGAREIEPGTFHELAQLWNAGEDYRGWYEDRDSSSHRQYLLSAEQTLAEAEKRGADAELLELGWRHMLHCAYETAWHDSTSYVANDSSDNNRSRRLAAWAAALASHARSCSIIAMAAEWFARRDGAAHVEAADIDGDGEPELVLKNDQLFAVFAPLRGGRLTFLFDLMGRSGSLVIGNVSDDWNLQEELHRYMDCPRNHPGALADVGHEHDRYEPVVLDPHDDEVRVWLRNREPESRLYGVEKRLSLAADAGHLCVTYVLTKASGRLSTEVCFSPDYHRLLRHGRDGIAAFQGNDWKGWGNDGALVWARINPEEFTIWDKPYQAECGHGINLRITSFSRNFHIELGVGIPPHQACHSSECCELLEARK